MQKDITSHIGKSWNKIGLVAFSWDLMMVNDG
jgi:hypothetical protein